MAEEAARLHAQKISDNATRATEAVKAEMAVTIKEKREQAEVDSKVHVEQVISSYRAMINHQCNMAYEARVAQIEEAYRQQKAMLTFKLNEISKLAEKTYLEYMSKVEQDISLMIRTQIDVYLTKNHVEDLEKQKSIQSSLNALKAEQKSLQEQMSSHNLKKETIVSTQSA